MRISDWSSDVCSSDLGQPVAQAQHRCIIEERREPHGSGLDHEVDDDCARVALAVNDLDVVAEAAAQLVEQGQRVVVVDEAHRLARLERAQRAEDRRVAEKSEEHTSELQSLMRISAAVY